METYTYKLVEDEHGNIQCGDKLYRFEETIKYGGYMKIIDLLNKIANGEEVPKKVEFDDDIYEYDYDEKNYAHFFIDHYNYLFDENIMQILDDKVEILEEENKIEKLELKDNWCRKKGDYIITDYEINPLILNKINEIIDFLKSKGE